MKHISNEESDRAILEAPSGSQWHVKLSKTENGTFYQDGSQDFVRCYSLWNNEFLVFRYDGNMHFNVVILDNSGCEREYAFLIEREYAFPIEKRWVGRLPRNRDGSTEISSARACRRDSGKNNLLLWI
ncbi:hypothetical protein MKX01_005755 [Papaver californicum]|nr:hypothetical protein MKX01_005755 [Papaver californicum]